ncbi:hypothetical protein TYRP_022682 [Tyrophagus putrescentiae]|nr:hypothetical protein TYRP_022682 [Tyrophagus putrescentiae]
MTSGAKSDLGALDDSETSLCELDDGNGILVRPNSTGVPPLHGGGGNFGPGATSMMSPLELTCLTGGGVGQPSMFSPNITGNMIMPFGGVGVGGLPLPPQQLGPNHLLTTSSSVSESSLTPIDKLYSMQNSYFSSSSTAVPF